MRVLHSEPLRCWFTCVTSSAPSPSGVAAQVAGGLVRLGVAALDEELIANDLVLIRSVLVAVGSGLVAICCRLIEIR